MIPQGSNQVRLSTDGGEIYVDEFTVELIKDQ